MVEGRVTQISRPYSANENDCAIKEFYISIKVNI